LKSPNRKRVAKENWLMAYNTHEPIISQEMFDNVQKILKSHRREGKNSGYLNIFSGIIKCETCGHAMCQNKSHRNPKENPIENVDFRCCNYTSNGKKLSGCTSHTVRVSVLHKIILEDVRKQAESALKNQNFAENLRKKLSKNTVSATADLRKEMRKCKVRLSELDNIFLELYNDKISEKISERNFSMLSQKYEKEQNQLQNWISEIENILSAEDKSKQNVSDFTLEIQKYADIIELTSEILNRLIDKITIGEKYTGEDGEIHQNITIYYKFIGNIL
ncbi:MAG: DUF4368 domain-containing protein, partial [Oscillospiraceae bacterium]|nr:DUF4368 domain-containing protein [Oscillospiraceae bacterium]